MLVNVADDDVTYPYLHIIASILAWASAIINPFIYAFKNRQYQQAFVKVTFFQMDIVIGIDISSSFSNNMKYYILIMHYAFSNLTDIMFWESWK